MTIQILLVDDDQADAAMAARLLREWALFSKQQVDIRHVLNLDTAITELTQHRFNYIFTDLSVPPYQGARIIELLKPVSNNVPIIAYSGHLDAERIADALSAGAASFIPKSAGRDSFGPAMASAERQNALETAMSELSEQVHDLRKMFADIDRDGLSNDDMARIAKSVAHETITGVFRALGVDPGDHRDMRETHNDLAWLRDYRKCVGATLSRLRVSMLSLIAAGVLGALWLGLKETLQGK